MTLKNAGRQRKDALAERHPKKPVICWRTLSAQYDERNSLNYKDKTTLRAKSIRVEARVNMEYDIC